MLKRRSVEISKMAIRYVGKESNELEHAQILGVLEESYTEYDDPNDHEIKKFIMTVPSTNAPRYGFSVRIWRYWRGKIPRGQAIVSKKRTRKMLRSMVSP